MPEKSGSKARVGAATSSTGTVLRTFRLAIAANKEFTKLKDNDDINVSFNAVVVYVNRMNAVYRQELSVAFTLVSGTYTVFNSTNDPGYINSDHSSMLDKNQSVLDGIIGNANCDVGHVLGPTGTGASGGGIAIGSSACQPATKAKGVTVMGDLSFFAPVFDDQTLSHEVGHQFSMDHTFNSSIPVCTTREAKTSVEPGSGTTIMSYGYTCSEANNPAWNDDYETPLYLSIRLAISRLSRISIRYRTLPRPRSITRFLSLPTSPLTLRFLNRLRSSWRQPLSIRIPAITSRSHGKESTSALKYLTLLPWLIQPNHRFSGVTHRWQPGSGHVPGWRPF